MNKTVRFIIIVALGFTFIMMGLLMGVLIARNDPNIEYITVEPEPFVPEGIDTAKLMALVNEQRTKHGIAPLATNESLNASACGKADDMMTRQYWSHYAPDGTAPWHFLEQQGYTYSRAGENLLIGGDGEAKSIEAWMNSPSHREAILDPTYTEQGMCVRTGEFLNIERNLVVNHFGRR